MIADHDFDDYRNRRVLIMGLGSFGGGLGAAQFMARRGAIVTITDQRPAEQLQDSLALLRDAEPARWVLGRHDRADFEAAELIVANPAVKRDCPYLAAARAAGVPITSEMNLFWKWNRAPIVGVTGSNGKSTTTALTHAILQQFLQTQGRRAWLGGNIGRSLLPDVEQIQPQDIVVLELSSFQLADLDRLQVSPHIAVVTNFAPNHLDWHPDLEHYRRSKQTILHWQTATDIAVLNDDDPDVRQWKVRGERRGFGVRNSSASGAFQVDHDAIIRIPTAELRFPVSRWLRLPGEHNLANALAASVAAVSLGADEEQIRNGLTTYEPLPHRLQWVADVAGRSFYNDSLATTPESAIVGLQAFERPIVLLAGGYDKHVDLGAFAASIARQAKAVALMGQTAMPLSELIQQHADRTCVVSAPQPSFAAAFEWAVAQTEPGDVVLLSPGCASYDWFRNFSDRGAQFVQLVERYNSEIPPNAR